AASWVDIGGNSWLSDPRTSCPASCKSPANAPIPVPPMPMRWTFKAAARMDLTRAHGQAAARMRRDTRGPLRLWRAPRIDTQKDHAPADRACPTPMGDLTVSHERRAYARVRVRIDSRVTTPDGEVRGQTLDL